MLNGIEGAWTDDSTRRQWRSEWTTEFDHLRATLLPVSPSSTLA
jgi:adenosine deaminase